jgi:signal transduction histidine kinase
MAKHNQKLRTALEHALPWLVLSILLFYTYAKFAQHPYSGFRLDTDGQVVTFYVPNAEQLLKVGDQVIQIDTLLWDNFKADYRKTIFKGVQPGQVVSLMIDRDGRQGAIPWVFPGPNPLEILDLIINEGWLAYVFWLVGTLAWLHLRPKDDRWGLMMAFNYLTAIWLVAGSGVSFYHIWGSAFVLRMAIWLCVPVYLHFHWIYPKPFGKLPAPVIWSVYIAASVLALAEWFQLLPSGAYFMGFLLAVGGSLVLLSAHVTLQAEARRDLRLLLIATLLALVPAVIVGFLGTFSTIPTPSGAGTIGLPFLPLAYFYASYRRQLGQSELRVNRWISTVIFLIFIGAITALFTALASLQIKSEGNALLFGAVLAILIALISIWGFPSFQMFVERRLLRIPLPPRNLLEIYSARLATSTSLSNLLKLLGDEVLPSLLVRQFAFLKFENYSPELLLAKGLDDKQNLKGCDFTRLLESAGKYRPASLLNEQETCHWARLILPLKVGESVLGFWLFGRRDPDDYYSPSEIPILQSLASQTAIALSNILQTERLRAMYLANVDRYEEERLHLALELHDSILNQLAVLMMNMDAHNPTAKFQGAYDDLTKHLRDIVSDLRPPMLNYGLEPAIGELADNLMERSKDTIRIDMNVQSDGSRYPEKIELHLFRIVQEACENALRHAQAKNITISGTLFSQEIDLSLKDDGIGFDAGENLQLDVLITNRHFGLAGMMERAAIIGAEVRIKSKPEEGTGIQITWKPSPG